MTEFMKRAHGLNRYANILEDGKVEVLERIDTIKDALKKLDLNGKFEYEDIEFYQSIGLPITYQGLRDELMIHMYTRDAIDTELYDLNHTLDFLLRGDKG